MFGRCSSNARGARSDRWILPWILSIVGLFHGCHFPNQPWQQQQQTVSEKRCYWILENETSDSKKQTLQHSTSIYDHLHASYRNTYIYICMYVYTCIYMYIIYVYEYICNYIYNFIYIYIYVYRHIEIHNLI